MVSYGRVIGGHYLNGTVSPGMGNDLVVKAGLKWRKLSAEQVAEWEEISSSSKTSKVSAVGQAVAGAALPSFVGKAASAAVGAAFDSTPRPTHTVRVDWVDGKHSLIELPDNLFVHLALVLKSHQASPIEPIQAAVTAAPAPAAPPSVAELAITHLSGLLKDRLPRPTAEAATPPAPTPTVQPDVTVQLTKLAALRDSGILTEDEFAAKKAELLARI